MTRKYERERKSWSYPAGRRNVNRVLVYQRGNWCIRMKYHDSVDVSLGHRDRERAKREADAKAREIHPGPRSRRNEAKILAMRQDLVRVARALGCPEGVAPPLTQYRMLGAFGEMAVRGQFNRADQWKATMHRYGLKPYSEGAWSPPGEAAVLADIKRVALKLGKPMRMPSMNEYDRHGRWTRATALRHCGTGRWGAIAQMLGLSITEGRRWKARVPTKANPKTQRAA